MVSDEELAKIGYAALVKSSVAHPNPDLTWENLPTLEMIEFTAFATAVRESSQTDAEENIREYRGRRDENAAHFVEAVDIAFRQMTVRSTAETAAWYTLRDWLKEHQDESK